MDDMSTSVDGGASAAGLAGIKSSGEEWGMILVIQEPKPNEMFRFGREMKPYIICSA